jgi:hypothetical protein
VIQAHSTLVLRRSRQNEVRNQPGIHGTMRGTNGAVLRVLVTGIVCGLVDRMWVVGFPGQSLRIAAAPVTMTKRRWSTDLGDRHLAPEDGEA